MKGKELQVHKKKEILGKAGVAEGQCEKGKCFGQKEIQLRHWALGNGRTTLSLVGKGENGEKGEKREKRKRERG